MAEKKDQKIVASVNVLDSVLFGYFYYKFKHEISLVGKK